MFTNLYLTERLWGPHIIRQPQNTTFNLDSESADRSTYLDCEAEGTPKPIYSWKKDDVEVVMTDDVFLTSGGRLTINDPDRNVHRGWYQCFASNEVGTVMSKPAYLDFACEYICTLHSYKGQERVMYCTLPFE